MVPLVRSIAMAVVLVGAAPASAQDFAMRCESRDFAHNFCPSGGRVVSAQLVRQLSRAPCQLGRTWGWQGHGIWVSDGCAGDFQVRSSSPPPPPPSANLVACESREYRYNFCHTGRVRSAELVRQRSRAPCLQGRTWGWTRDGIWVDQGCEGTFRIR